jgi:DNA-binding response OmpR family regulator
MPKSVLLVDDEPRDLEVLGHLLEEHGYSVFRAASYAQALMVASGIPNGPDVLVCDVSLPDVNGLEVHRELAKILGRELNVLFISAYSGAEVLRFHGIALSDVHFLAKPFSARELTERVERLLTNPVPLLMAS